MKDKLSKFSSVSEALRKIETGQFNQYIKKHGVERASLENNFSFTQTNSLEEAISLARNGWPKGDKIIRDLTEKHQDAFIKLFPKQDWSINLAPELSGEIVNMDAVLTGQPETMLHFNEDLEKVKSQQNGKMQRIIVSGICSCYINRDTIFNRGAIVSSMINTMELSGFRTELWLVQCIASNGIKLKYFYKIKDFDEDLNLNHISFAFCHPSMLRRINFALQEMEPEEEVVNYFLNNGYGTPIDIRDEEIQLFGNENQGEALHHGNIYFETLSRNSTFGDLVENTKTKIEQHFTKIKI